LYAGAFGQYVLLIRPQILNLTKLLVILKKAFSCRYCSHLRIQKT